MRWGTKWLKQSEAVVEEKLIRSLKYKNTSFRASAFSFSCSSSVVLTRRHDHRDTITSLHLSRHSPTLLLGTSTSTIHVLSLPSLLPTRIIPPALSSTSPGPITFLSTLLRPSDLGTAASNTIGEGLPARVVMKNGMGRSVKDSEWGKGGKGGRTISMRIGKSDDVRELIAMPVLRSLSSCYSSGSAGAGGVGAGDKRGDGGKGEEAMKIGALEEEVLSLKHQLSKAIGMNEAMWKKVVESRMEVER